MPIGDIESLAIEFAGTGGCYALWIRRRAGARIRVGARGLVSFPAGDYVYVGRAKKSLGARLKRHAGSRRRSHWHIDYLLSEPGSSLVSAVVFPGDDCDECGLARRVAGISGAVPVGGFGNSDCRQKCPAHLFRFRRRLSAPELAWERGPVRT